MDSTLDMILTFGAIIIGILLLTGHGEFFMKGGNEQERRNQYDEKKMEKYSGIALILIGIVTGIDSFTTGIPAKIVYIVVLAVIFAGLMYCIRVKCRK